MDPRLMIGTQHRQLCCDAGPKPPRAPRTALVVHAVVALLAILAGLASVALAGGSLVDGRFDGPGFRVGSAASALPPDSDRPQRANAAKVESSRSTIALHSAASTKLASKLLRASA